MDLCTNCGEPLNEFSRSCSNCHAQVENVKETITTNPTTRIEKRKKTHSKTLRSTKKGLVTGVASIIGLVILFCVSYFVTQEFNKHEQKTVATKTKTAVKSTAPTKPENPENSGKSSTTPPAETSKPSANASTYIFPNSDKTLLTEQDLAPLTKAQLRLARNEIYARHGYVFKSADLQAYFSSKPWYHANPSYKMSLNHVEMENIKILKAKEDSLQS